MNSKNNKNESLIEYIDSLISELNIVRNHGNYSAVCA